MGRTVPTTNHAVDGAIHNLRVIRGGRATGDKKLWDDFMRTARLKETAVSLAVWYDPFDAMVLSLLFARNEMIRRRGEPPRVARHDARWGISPERAPDCRIGVGGRLFYLGVDGAGVTVSLDDFADVPSMQPASLYLHRPVAVNYLHDPFHHRREIVAARSPEPPLEAFTEHAVAQDEPQVHPIALSPSVLRIRHTA